MPRIELIVPLFVVLCLAAGADVFGDSRSPTRATEADRNTENAVDDDEQQRHRQEGFW